jgi:HTH-type transcriptional regulator, transcriptional repressor of NAD biosynthesis genes
MRGLVLGKFYPPHNGHHFLIDEAAALCDELIVLVLAATVESVPMATRHHWLAARHPHVIVRSALDDVPVDYQDEGIWQQHMDIITNAVPEKIDVVFSSEEYGDELATRLGARHHLIDIKREIHKVSGTSVRQDTFGNWHHLDPLVRAGLALRVVVCGAESTGTTTLSKALAAYYQTAWVPEYGRQRSMEKLAATGKDEWTPEDFIVTATTQSYLEDQAARQSGPVLIADTDALATCIFEELYLGQANSITEYVADSRMPDLYILTSDKGIDFEDDGTRLFEHQRPATTNRFRQRLARRPAPWVELTGSKEERLAQAVRLIDDLLADGKRFATPLTQPTVLE